MKPTGSGTPWHRTFKGKPCPNPIKGRRCKVCGKDYVCLAQRKEPKK